MKLTKEECKGSIDNLFYGDDSLGDVARLDKLVELYFDNPPLKFEDLEDVTGVWDNKYKKWCLVLKEEDSKIVIKYSNYSMCAYFEDDRFYRKKVEEK